MEQRLPSHWRRVRLGDYCEIISGATPSRDIPEYWEGDIDWVTPKDLSKLNGPVLNEAPEKITEAGYRSCSTTLMPKGAILFSSRAPIGLVAIAGRPMCTNQGFKSVVPGSDVVSEYLYWCLRWLAPEIAKQGTGTTFKEIAKPIMERVEIPLPPLDEQRRIAAILDKADAIRRKRQESIRLTEEFLRSTFLEMFGDPVTNPKGLKTGMLGDYCDMETGYAFKSEAFQDTGIKLCRGANVLPGEIDWSDVKYWSNDAQIAERYVLREGDVVLAMDRPWISSGLKVARVSKSDLPSYLVQRVARLRGAKGLSNEFIYFCIKHPSFTKHCKPKITETTVPHISPLDIRSHQILIPDANLVESFSKIAVTILQTEIKLQKQAHNTESLFNSLTNRAFRGEL